MTTNLAPAIDSPFHMDESKLVEKFIQGSNQLLSSDRLRLEVIGAVSQLTIAKSSEPIAMMYLTGTPRTVAIKKTAAWYEQLDTELLSRDFVCFGESKKPGFIEYKQFVTPAGYRVCYTEPAILWKKWWPTERFQNKQRFNMNILISIKDNWYPVRNMTVHGGLFTIDTIAGKVTLKREERVLWLAQTNPDAAPVGNDIETVENTQINPPATPAQSQLRDKFHDKIEELEQRLTAQQQLYAELEEKLLLSQQLANVAEKRLEVVHRYLTKQGISLKDVYRG